MDSLKGLLLVVLGAATLSAAPQQGDDEIHPLNRVVVADPGGGPWMLVPPISPYSDKAPLAVARAARVVLGMEVMPGMTTHEPITPEVAAALRTRDRVSLAGKTVREALDAFVAIDARYRWVDIHGVPVVRPLNAWVDPLNPLNLVGGPIDWHDVKLGTALSLLMTGLSGMTHSGPHPADARSHPFSLHLETAGLLEMLNGIAHAHGNLMWEVRPMCWSGPAGKRPKGNALSIGFTSFEGWGSSNCFFIPPPEQSEEPR